MQMLVQIRKQKVPVLLTVSVSYLIQVQLQIYFQNISVCAAAEMTACRGACSLSMGTHLHVLVGQSLPRLARPAPEL